MGRPREHDAQTRQALLDAAERIVADQGIDALSVRGVADEIGTTTRAVYSLFGSKEGLFVALGAQAFGILAGKVTAQRLTDDPLHNLAIAGLAFRDFALKHPALFRIGIQRMLPDAALAAEFAAAAQAAFAVLLGRVQAVADAGLLPGRSVRSVATQYHSLCEGLASVELRGAPAPDRAWAPLWKDALESFVAGVTIA